MLVDVVGVFQRRQSASPKLGTKINDDIIIPLLQSITPFYGNALIIGQGVQTVSHLVMESQWVTFSKLTLSLYLECY